MGFTVTATHRGYRFAIERESAAALVFDRPPPAHRQVLYSIIREGSLRIR